MNLLAIDTSSDYLSLAVMKDGKVAASLHRRCAMAHSSMLIPMIDRLLKKSRLRAGEIDYFAISIGPGSFTGLRIGVTTVKGLAYSLKKRIVAVPTLDVIARNVKNFRGMICPVLNARKNKVYACIYKSDGKNIKRASKYLLLSVNELMERTKRYGEVLFLDDGVLGPSPANSLTPGGIRIKSASQILGPSSAPIRRVLRIKFASQIWYPRARVVAELALAEIAKKNFVKPEDLEPLYLYSKECDITGK